MYQTSSAVGFSAKKVPTEPVLQCSALAEPSGNYASELWEL
jgi:hypothetical protein